MQLAPTKSGPIRIARERQPASTQRTIGSREHELILAVHQAPLEDPPWKVFLSKLRHVLHSNFVHLSFRHAPSQGGGRLTISDAGDVPSWLHARAAAFRHYDPIPWFQMVPGRVYTYDEFETVKGLNEDPFWKNVLDAAGCHHLLTFQVEDRSGCRLWLTLTRHNKQGEFGAEERELCTRLAAHLSITLEVHTDRVRAAGKLQIHSRATRAFAFGIVGLDGSGRIISTDATAIETLGQTDALHVVRGRMRARVEDPALQRLLSASLAADASAGAIQIGGAGGVDILAVPQAVRVDADPATARVVLYLSSCRRLGPDMSEQLQELHGLTATQARLAMLIVSGRSISEAADELGVTVQSARTYTKEIYSKMKVKRQGQLIHDVLTSATILGAALKRN